MAESRERDICAVCNVLACLSTHVLTYCPPLNTTLPRYMYMCDEFKTKDVIELDKQCAAQVAALVAVEPPGADGTRPTRANLQGNVDLLDAHTLVILPVRALRSCAKLGVPRRARQQAASKLDPPILRVCISSLHASPRCRAIHVTRLIVPPLPLLHPIHIHRLASLIPRTPPAHASHARVPRTHLQIPVRDCSRRPGYALNKPPDDTAAMCVRQSDGDTRSPTCYGGQCGEFHPGYSSLKIERLGQGVHHCKCKKEHPPMIQVCAVATMAAREERTKERERERPGMTDDML